jgi:hypothetical protein
MTERFTDDAIVEQSPDALSRRVLGGVLVLGPTMTEAFHISAPGDTIWTLVREPLTVSELIGALSELYGVPTETVRHQIQSTLDTLVGGGAVLLTAADRS